MSRPIVSPCEPTLMEEAYAVLFRIVRSNVLGQAIGHDVMVAARSVVRRLYPDAYADLMKRRKKAGLPEHSEDERGKTP